MDRYRYWRHDAIVRDLDTRRHEFHVAVENWGHDFNIGSVVRTANAFLARGGPHRRRRRWNRRGAMVTDRYQHVRHHESVRLSRGPRGSRAACRSSGIDNLPGSVPLETYDLPRRCILLFGQEGPGLSAPAREACVGTFSIAQFGSTRSINAVAPRPRSPCTPGSRSTRPGRDPSGAADARCGSPRPCCTDPQQRASNGATRDGGSPMPIATPEVYAEMLDRAKAGTFAYPAINVSSSQTLNAALQGFADAGSDGIVQVSTGGAEYLSGPTVKNMVSRLGRPRGVRPRGGQELRRQHRAAHRPLPQGQARRVRPAAARRLRGAGEGAASSRCSSRTCGTARRCRSRRTSQIAEELLATCRRPPTSSWRSRSAWSAARRTASRARSTTSSTRTPEDAIATVKALGTRRERPLPHGADLRQRARRLQAGQRQAAPGDPQAGPGGGRRGVGLRPSAKPFDLVFHGGSGSLPEEIPAAVDYGVVKMNVDTDTQYAFTRPVAGHMFTNYDGVLKVDGEVGNKKPYDPRAWGKAAEAGMAARVVEACEHLRSAGTHA